MIGFPFAFINIVNPVINANTAFLKSCPSHTVPLAFLDSTIDSSGNIYCVGYINGFSGVNFGSGSVTSINTSSNAVLVKYSNTGVCLMTKTTLSGTGRTKFTSVSVDSSGNIYCAGTASGTLDLGSGSISSSSGILAKYNSSGTCLYTKTDFGLSAMGQFNSVKTDSSGNVYCVGTVYGTGNINFGSGQISKTSSNQWSVLVKYDSSGNCLFTKVGPDYTYSNFFDVCIDSSGNIYCAGVISTGTAGSTVNFGSGNITTPFYSNSALIVKYSSSGTCSGIFIPSLSNNLTSFSGIDISSDGNIVCCGNISSGTHNFGSGQFTTTGGTIFARYSNSLSTILVVPSNSGGTYNGISSTQTVPSKSVCVGSLSSSSTYIDIYNIDGTISKSIYSSSSSTHSLNNASCSAGLISCAGSLASQGTVAYDSASITAIPYDSCLLAVFNYT